MSFERATRRGLTVAAVLVAGLAGAPAASAASAEDRAAARQHLSQAEELQKKGQLAEACKHWEEVERLDPKLPTLMELAECTEKLGKPVEAQAWWSLARDRAKHDEKPQSKARAETRLAAVQKRVAHLTLQLAASAPAGVQVLRDDVPLEAASLASDLPMNPGEHVIVVKAAGHDDAKYTVKLGNGDNQTLAIAAGPPTAPQTSASPASLSPSPSPSLSAPLPSLTPSAVAEPAKPEAQPKAGWWTGPHEAGVIFGSAGLVAIGVGSALYAIHSGDTKHGSAADPRLLGGGIALASGGVLLVSGLVLLATGSSDEASQHARLTVTPTLLVARNATVLGAAGQF